MERWLTRFSTTVIAFVLIGMGILLIIAINPPKTICDSQIDIFKESQSGFLYKKSNSKFVKSTGFDRAVNLCRDTSAQGGCSELFMKTRLLLDDIDNVANQCTSEVANLPAVKKTLMTTVDLMVQLTWLENKESNFLKKLGWLDAGDVNFFCRLRNQIKSSYGEDTWERKREEYLSSLPGIDKMSREEAWKSILLSVPCQRYL